MTGNKMGTISKRKRVKCLKINNLTLFIVPRPGIEPGRIAPLVFETSASTDSAIWAYGFLVKAVQRYIENIIIANFRRSILKEYS